MKWNARTRAARLKERAEMSFFLFVIFFAVFGVILLTKLMTIDVFTVPYVTRAKYDWQSWGILTYVQVETEAPPPPPPAAHEPLDHVWKPVVGTSFKFFVFSAFVERRTEAAVRVIGATKTRNPDPVVCRLFLHDNRTFTLKANVTDDPKAPAPLVTARKTRRSIPLKFRVRSKYAVRPSEAVELGNHFVWQLPPGAVSTGVSTDRALLHHYRMKCEYGGVQCLTVASTVDRTAHRWSDELTVKVTKVQDQLKAICPMIKT